MAGKGAPLGNDNASRGKEFRQALMQAMATQSGGRGWRARLQEIAGKLADAAIAGESWAIQEVANRIDGKAPQAIEHSGSIVTEYTREQMIERLTALHATAIAAPIDGPTPGVIGADSGTAGE